jgi:hypothetical protein
MHLKRIFGEDKKRPSHVEVLQLSKRWNISPELVAGAARDGWLAIGDGKVVLKTDKGPLVFNMLFTPGWYCCFCNKELDNSVTGKIHVQDAHPRMVSPDKNNPSGWRRINHYELQLVEPHVARSFFDKLLGRNNG